MKSSARKWLAAGAVLAAAGLGALGLASPSAGGEGTAQASAPISRQQAGEVRRESVVRREGGPAPLVGAASRYLPLQAFGPVTWGPNYRANTDTQSPNLAQQEPSIAVNPTNPLNVVVAAKDERQAVNSKHVYIYTSTDGGVTWLNQRFPYRTPVPSFSSDPVVNFADDGVCYVTSLPYGTGTVGIQVARSDDGCITFNTVGQVTTNPDSDKEWTWIDNFPSSPYYHRMYVAWRNFGSGADIVLNYSTDRGATWSVDVAAALTAYQFPMPVVLPNGDVLVTYLQSFSTLNVSRSTNGGVSFSGSQTVSPISDPNCPPDNSSCSIWRLNPIPATGVNPTNGSSVIVWADGADGTSKIRYTRSTDSGATWSTSALLAPPGVANTYQVEPWVEADENGLFHAIWYDDRENPNTSIFHIYYSQSTDDGATWSPAVRISTASSDLRIGIPSSYALAAGDYIQVTASHGNVYATWTDTRSGTGEDIYVVRGTYGGGTPTPTATPCTPSGSWSVVPGQDPGAYNNYLMGVSALAPNDVWAVGYYNNSSGGANQTLIQRWNGTQWNVVPSPNAGSSSNWLYDVVAVAPNDVWAVGSYRFGTYDQTLILHWDGTAWTVVPSPNLGTWNNNLYSVAARSANEVWAVGSYIESLSTPARTLTMRWNGTAWAIVPSVNIGDSYNILRGVTTVGAEDVWAVGYYGSGTGNPDRTLTLLWDGVGWAQVTSANAPTGFSLLQGVDGTSPSDVWAVGYNTNPPGGQVRTLIEHFDSNNWSLVDSPNPGSASNFLYDISVISAGDAWAVGTFNNGGNSQTLALRYRDGQWVQVASPNAGASGNWPDAVDALSSSEAWMTGYYGPAGQYRVLTERYTGQPCITATPIATVTSTPTSTRTATRTTTPTVTPTQCITYLTATATATIVPGNVDIGNHCDTCLTNISLPFPFTMYGRTSSSANATSDGNLQFLTAYLIQDNYCLPANVGPTIFPHWDDLRTDCTGCGIFTSTSGSAPNRVFNIEWRAALSAGGGSANFEVRLFETSNNFSIILGQISGNATGATIGAQDAIGPPIQYSCNSNVPSGTGIHFTPLVCGATPTGTSTPVGPTHTPSATRTPPPCVMNFSDVQPTDWFYEYVFCVYCMNGGGVISGYNDGTFRPYNNVTRGQTAKIVVLAFNYAIYTPPTPTFSDVPTSNPFYPYVETAAFNGIISGYSDGTFRPYNDVTRGQIAKMVALAAQWTLIEPPTPTFSDVPAGSPFYTHIETAYCNGAISGYADGTYRPQNNATRAQLAKIVCQSVRDPVPCVIPTPTSTG